MVFMCLQYKSFKSTVGKGEIAHNKQFLHFHSVFYAFGELSAIFIKFKIFVCNLFQFGRVFHFVFFFFFLNLSFIGFYTLRENEKMLVNQQFLLFPECFRKGFPQWHYKSSLCGKGLTLSLTTEKIPICYGSTCPSFPPLIVNPLPCNPDF